MQEVYYMPFMNIKFKKDSEKCFACKFNYMNNFEIRKKGYVHFLEMEDKIKSVLRGTMVSICSMCPYKSKFEMMYGKAPVDYFTK